MPSSGEVLDLVEVISDDTASASEGDDAQTPKPTRKALGKRKAEFVPGEKVIWDADSDDGLDLQSKLKKRKRGKSEKNRKSANVKGEKSTDQLHDYEIAGVPDYLLERRVKFDENRQVLQDAGLLLPPEFDDYGPRQWAPVHEPVLERPQFDEISSVKPCRPYQDIELEHSAGVIPAPIAQYLRDYQVEGVRFLHRLFVYQKGGILGDDMGLGKTVQVAAFLTAACGKTGDERDFKRMSFMRATARRWYPRILIICPGTLIENWKNELDRWGWWHVDLYHGATTHKEDVLANSHAGNTEVMITTYHTYKNSESAINMVKWDVVVADECHAIKRASAEITKAMDRVNALCRIGLTGTAIQNNYAELWTLLNWTNPGRVGTASEWDRTIAKPLRLGQSHDATLYQLKTARETAKKLVQNLLPGFFLRRMKTLIAHQLPKKSDRVVFCPLTDEQRDAYKRFTETPEIELLRTLTDPCDCGKEGAKMGWCCHKLLPNGKPWMTIVFPAVITLQKLANHLTLLVPISDDQPDKQNRELKTLQACCPASWSYLYQNRAAILTLANPEFCGKWKVLKKLLNFWHKNGDKVLVFSHSVRLLRILQILFNNTSYNVTYLDGSLSYVERQQAVDNFNSDPSQFVFLISTKAGGVGLNITAANKVVIVDPHWNPAYDLQAQDRAYRIGQRRDVDVFRLVSSGTIEEIVYARQIYKQQQANIGYTASSERRYFSGVQEDESRKGEIFGLRNLFTYREDQLVIRDIVNKTNIAEAKHGIALVGLDMERAADDEEVKWMKQENPDGNGPSDDGGMSQLAKLITSKPSKRSSPSRQPGSDAIQAILSSAGVEYSHENSEVIGTSKVEENLSRAAEMADSVAPNPDGDSALFANEPAAGLQGQGRVVQYLYNPPPEVMRRQFCSMAREFRFASVTQFALVVESWTQEQRRNCLEKFYKIREGKLLAAETVEREGALDVDALLAVPVPEAKTEVKTEAKTEIKTEVKTEARTEVKTEVKAGVKQEVKTPQQARGSIYVDVADDDDDDEL